MCLKIKASMGKIQKRENVVGKSMNLHTVSAFRGLRKSVTIQQELLTDGNVRPLSRNLISQQLFPLWIALDCLSEYDEAPFVFCKMLFSPSQRCVKFLIFSGHTVA